jgi:hypothetical protein
MPHKQKDYFLYLPRTPERERWGVEVLGGGFARIPAKIYYPPIGHPSDHSFNYEKGSVLLRHRGQGSAENRLQLDAEDHRRERLCFDSRGVAHLSSRPEDWLG